MSEVDKVVSLFEQEHSLKLITKELGISMHRARKLLSAKGIIINETHQKIMELYEIGKSPEKIAEVLHLSTSVVNSYLPPKRPLYKIDRSKNAVRIKKKKKKKGV